MLNYFNIKTKISQLNSKKKLEKYQNTVIISIKLIEIQNKFTNDKYYVFYAQYPNCSNNILISKPPTTLFKKILNDKLKNYNS